MLYGQDVFVTALVQQGHVQRMLLSSRNAACQEQLLPMLAQSDHKFQAILTRVHGTTHAGRAFGQQSFSAKHLDVTMTPKLLHPIVTITPPAYTRGSTYRGGVPDQGLGRIVRHPKSIGNAQQSPAGRGSIVDQYADGQSELIKLLTW